MNILNHSIMYTTDMKMLIMSLVLVSLCKNIKTFSIMSIVDDQALVLNESLVLLIMKESYAWHSKKGTSVYYLCTYYVCTIIGKIDF